MQNPRRLTVFRNGFVACFDSTGAQVADLQTPWHVLWAENATRLGYDVEGVQIEDRNGIWTLLKGEEGNWYLK